MNYVVWSIERSRRLMEDAANAAKNKDDNAFTVAMSHAKAWMAVADKDYRKARTKEKR